MFKKFGIMLITTLALTINVNASSDGGLVLKKNDPNDSKGFEVIFDHNYVVEEGVYHLFTHYCGSFCSRNSSDILYKHP